MTRPIRVVERSPLDREHGIVLRRKKDGWWWQRWTLAGTRIELRVLWGYWKAGDSVEQIARSYGLSTDQVWQALNWCEKRSEAARKGWRSRRPAGGRGGE